MTTRFVDTVTAEGRERSGVFYAPANGSGAGKTAFMVVYGYGGDIMWSSNHWLCVRLAQAGHACLVPQTAGGGPNVIRTTLESEMPDFAAWADWLEDNGYDRLVMAGHSWGGIRITRYIVSSEDPRVVGMVYLAPTADAPPWAEKGFGKDAYDRLVAEAEAAVAAGDGYRVLVDAPFVSPPPAPPRPRPQMAASFLSHWGPEANTVHTEQIRRVNVPVLSIAGNLDTFVDERYLRQFTRAAGGPGDARWYDDGAPHSLIGWEQRTTDDIIAWLEDRVD